ncbi:hypothetical protein NCHU2750_24650 [Neorhizobium sp. NCHU2750]|nr:hypothetical protein NCHU2750_24650 [Neorhizobium sp. NCHU2750]
MLSAKRSSMPEIRPAREAGKGFFHAYLRLHLARFFGGLARDGAAHGGKASVPTLPDDLRADIGLGEPMPGRVERFWQDKRLSAARDLPL